MTMRTKFLIFCYAGTLALSGCGLFRNSAPAPGDSNPGAAIAFSDHNALSLHNYGTARAYSAQGRYELAREHFLLAYAAAGDDAVLRGMLAKELEAVDLMIRALR